MVPQIITAVSLTLSTLAMIPGQVVSYVSPDQNRASEATTERLNYVPTQRQEVWLSALEWCESGGRPEAINPKDLDNTPSYGAFQFKPSTFDLYLKNYELKGELMDRNAQRQIVSEMLNDGSVKWTHQFPDCVRKLGLPPRN